MSKTQPSLVQTVRKLKEQLPPESLNYLLLNLKEFQQDPLEHYLHTLPEYGDFVHVPFMLGYTGYLCAHATHAEHILQSHQKCYGKPDVF